MRLNIMVVSKSRQRRNAISSWIMAGCEALNFDLEGMYQAKKIEEAYQKIKEATVNVVLCDNSLEEWKKFSLAFKRTGSNKVFILIDDEKTGCNYDDPAVDGFFCSQSIKKNTRQACDIIAQMVSKKYLGKKVVC